MAVAAERGEHAWCAAPPRPWSPSVSAVARPAKLPSLEPALPTCRERQSQVGQWQAEQDTTTTASVTAAAGQSRARRAPRDPATSGWSRSARVMLGPGRGALSHSVAVTMTSCATDSAAAAGRSRSCVVRNQISVSIVRNRVSPSTITIP